MFILDLGLNGKIALTTASSKGLGFASALELAREGANVILSARREDELIEASKRIKNETNSDVFWHKVDLTDLNSIKKLFEWIEKNIGTLDILVYSTGGPRPGNFFDLSINDFEKACKLLALSAIETSRRASSFMIKKGWGRIILIGSISLLKPLNRLALSNIMRTPIIGLTRTLAVELAPYNITVNAVLPGTILTDRVRNLAENIAERENITLDEAVKKIAESPMKRVGLPEELATVIAFLASEKASYITGTLIPVDGGASLL